MTKPELLNATALVAALPGELGARVRPTTRLNYNIGRALREQRWTVEQLAAEAARDLDNAASIGAVIDDRMSVCATIPPPHAKTSKPKVHDGCCEGGWIYDETVDPVRTTKCPGNRTERTPA